MRAYTPLSIDTVAGRIKILAYLHGESPGSIWARSAQPGHLTNILGPQQSLDLIGLSQPVVFFEDETSFAAAKTLQSHLSSGNATRFVFEVFSEVEAQAVVDRLELRDVKCYKRQPDDSHIPLVTDAIQQALASVATSHLVLTGKGALFKPYALASAPGIPAQSTIASKLIGHRARLAWNDPPIIPPAK